MLSGSIPLWSIGPVMIAPCTVASAIPVRPILSLAAAALVASLLAGCVTDREPTGSIRTTVPTAESDLQDYAAQWGRRYAADHANKAAALNYAAALRKLDRVPQAVAVLETAAIKFPYDTTVLAAYGKTLADAGRLKEAADVLSRAHTPDNPDWSVLSAQGSVADQLGDHRAAQGYYEAALKIAPDSAATLSNLGLSYALDKRLPEAEATLRRAVALPGATTRVRQNLSFVLALEGKDAEAESVARADLSPEDATANVAAVKAMVASPLSTRGRKPAQRAAINQPTNG